jgi:putative ABC transport system permease protein
MFLHYLKTAIRFLKRQKGYSFINIFGLSMGLTICMFILLYIRYELSFDSHHKDVERIYRIMATVEGPTFTDKHPGLAPIFAGLIKGTLPQIEHVTWTWSHNVDSQVELGDKIFKEESKNVVFVDEDFLNIFSVKFKLGNSDTALAVPNSAIITAETAKKYFGTEVALDRTITVDSAAYRITGIIEDPPGNSIFQHKILKSWKVLEDPLGPSEQSAGFGGFYQTFLKLQSGVDAAELKNQLKDIVVERNQDYLESSQADVVVTLEPLRDIHFQPDIQFDFPAAGNVLYIYLFTGIAVFILLITSINFVNLSTASSASRAVEVGIRKTVGAQHRQLIVQFMGESFLTVAISYIIAFVMVNLLIPQFNALTSLRLEYATLFRADVLVGLMLLFVLEGIAAGIYPAFFLSSFKPVSVLKGAMKTGTRSGKLRRTLVIVQFSVSIILIVVTIVFNWQLHYMKNMPLGFEKEQMLIVDFQRHNYKYDPLSVKQEFLNHPSVIGASFSSSIPGRWLYPWEIWPSGQRKTNTHSIHAMGVDKDFLALYKIDLVAGEQFDARYRPRSWILSEKAIRTFGWDSPEDALNMTILDEWEVIGVMKDFHFTGLQRMIEPLGFFQTPLGSYLSLKIDTENIKETIAFIEQKYRSLFPDKYLEYFFLDDDFNRHYLKEEQMKKIFNVFTILGMFIACLGLFALSTFMAQQKTKEIGVRKILGASTVNITYMLTIEFVKWVVISITIAWPVSYMIASKVLQNFAYRIDLEVWMFMVSAFVAPLVALMTVCYQSIKAAQANPIECLRYE